MEYGATSDPRLEFKGIKQQIVTPLTAAVAAHGVLSVALAIYSGYRFDPGMAGLLAMVLGILVPWFLLVLLVRRVVLLAVRDKSQKPIQDLIGILVAMAKNRDLVMGGAFRLLLICFFVGSFGYQKELVAVFQPFGWDQAFAELDRFLHFGRDSYVLLQPMTGSPIAVTGLNAAYHLWFFLIYFAVFVACFAATHHRQSRNFLVALVLTFAIGGNLMAIVFSSAGPVYFERLGFGTDFAPLMTHLNNVAEVSPVWALGVQEDLWAGYQQNGQLAGISAMPSMHVATSVLMALYAFTHTRWLGWTMAIFAGLIMIGSVQLGWHYAVDGYAGGLIAAAAWWGLRRFA